MRRSALWLIVAIASLLLSALTCGGGLLVLATLFLNGLTPTVAETLPLAGLVALSLMCGVPLMWHGWAGWRGRPSCQFDPSRTWLLWLLLAILIGLGAVVSAWSLAPTWLLPSIHVLAMALPPLIILWMVGGVLRGVGGSWREVVAAVAGSGSVGFVAALVGEVLVAVALVVIVTIVALMVPGGVERVESLAENLQDLARRQDLTNLFELLLSPVAVVSALVLFSVPVPLIEEAFKTLAAGVVARWVRPHPARAFLWGVAGGAGFALVENLLGGALSGAEGWALGAVSRLGATVMHCLTGGLVGWGWGQLWTARRPLRLLGSYAIAVTIHGMWNAAAVGAGFLSASAMVHEGNTLALTLIGIGILTLVGLLGSLTMVFVAVLVVAGRRLADEALAASRDDVEPSAVVEREA